MKKLLHNYKLKAMALVLAVITWGIVKQITNNDKVINNVPVNLTLPEGWAVREMDDSNVKVTFRGTRDDLLRLDERTVQIQVNLRETEFEPEKTLRILPRQVAYTGSSARIMDIQPATLTVRLGKEGRKKLPVIINRTGEPPQGLKVEAIEVDPRVVSLYGAEDLLEGVNALRTAPLNLSDKLRSFEQRLDVLLPSREWVGRVEPPRVRVKVTLAGETEERKFTGVPLMLYHLAGHTVSGRQVADPETVDVFIKGSPQLLDELAVDRIRAFVHAGPTRENDAPREVNVLLPPGLDVIGIQPATVNVRTLSPPTPTPAPTPVPGEGEPEPTSSPPPEPDTP